MNLRELAEADLAVTLEDPADFALPVVLIDPNGVEYSYEGKIQYDTYTPTVTEQDVVTVVVHDPVVTLRRSSLTRVPQASEKWAVRIPITPSRTATKTTFMLEHASNGGGSIGYIKLYLTKAIQS